jgi:cytochrome c oxidase subunit I
MVLPAMGVASEIIACFARRRLFGYSFMVYALVGIAVIGFFVWGHHMFVSGQSAYPNVVFSFLSLMVAVPPAIKVFNWTGTLYRGSITFTAPML